MVVPVCHTEVNLGSYPLWPVTRHYPSVLNQNAWSIALMPARREYHEEMQVKVLSYCAILILPIVWLGEISTTSDMQIIPL